MPTMTTDPLAAHRAGCRTSNGKPIPLSDTDIRVTLDGGFAIVVFKRTFQNVEETSIEAVLTFPVPTDAVLTGLTASVDDRLLVGKAQAKVQARQSYEDAIDAGKSAVLHEEVLKGVHVLTVGRVAPDSRIVVESRWVQPLTFARDLLIPTTVGHIYGRSPMIEADDLLIEDVHQTATLHVDAPVQSLLGGKVMDETTVRDLSLAEQIALSFPGHLASTAHGNLDGRSVRVDARAIEAPSRKLSATVLADRSGSMDEPDRSTDARTTKFQSMIAGLKNAAAHFVSEDSLDAWQFSESFQHVGKAFGKDAAGLVDRILGPQGSTEIGRALAAIIANDPDADILLITDGRSHALDVQALAKGRHRITTVLIGKESLDAHVGHLSSLTGGQILVASSSDASLVIEKALETMRVPARRSAEVAAMPDAFAIARAGVDISVELSDGGAGTDDIGAYAAGLALAMLPEAAATDLALRAGIVSHLTSLILVDEAGEKQEGLPAMRKVPLAAPKSALRGLAPASMDAMAFASAAPSGLALRSAGSGGMMFRSASPRSRRPPLPSHASAHPLAVDWSKDPEALRSGHLGSLSSDVRIRIESMAKDERVIELAGRLGIAPVLMVLVALASTSSDRYAARFLRSFGNASGVEVAQLAAHLGIHAS